MRWQQKQGLDHAGRGWPAVLAEEPTYRLTPNYMSPRDRGAGKEVTLSFPFRVMYVVATLTYPGATHTVVHTHVRLCTGLYRYTYLATDMHAYLRIR